MSGRWQLIEAGIFGLTTLMALPVAVLAQVAVPDAAPPVPPRAVEPAPVVAEEIPQQVTIAGQVLRTKQVDIRGTTEKVLVALLDTGDGQRQIVELGPTANFKLTPIRTGDQIYVRGPRTTVGKLDVLLATQANIGGDLVAIKRVVPAALGAVVAAPAGYPVAERIIKIDGRIEHLRNARLAGSQQEHLVAEVVTRNARAIVVDLGPPSALWRADVKQGEWITIQGQQMNVNNRPVLLALEINKSGTPHLIDRHLVRDEPGAIVEKAVVEKAVVESTPVVERAAPVVAPAAVGERQIAP